MMPAAPNTDNTATTPAQRSAPQRLIERLTARAYRPVPSDFLIFFRLVFAAVMLSYVVMYFRNGYIDMYYVDPKFHFTWYGFSWVRPWSPTGMHVHYAVMGVLCVLMAIGLFYRLAAAAFALCFTYVFLLDKVQYQNHYYLIMMLSWIMAILPANRWWAVDARLWPSIRSGGWTPAWTLWLLRFAVGVPYFYGGIAKLSYDWLHGQPMRLALATKTWYPIIGQYFTEEWMVQIFVWGGTLLDLFIVPALLWKPTRLPAFFVGLMFHIMNATLFTIGVFPWFMMFATAVFFDPDWVRRLFRGVRTATTRAPRPAAAAPTRRQVLLISGLCTFAVLQLVIPFRHLLYPGDVNWTEEGHFFSWRMKLRGKQCAIRFQIDDHATNTTRRIDLTEYLTIRQASVFTRDPLMVLQFAHFLSEQLKQAGVKDHSIRVVNLVSLNGRKAQHLVDPDIDLTKVPIGWKFPREIIVPLHEPLRFHAWDLPVTEWEGAVGAPPRVDGGGQDSTPTPEHQGNEAPAWEQTSKTVGGSTGQFEPAKLSGADAAKWWEIEQNSCPLTLALSPAATLSAVDAGPLRGRGESACCARENIQSAESGTNAAATPAMVHRNPVLLSPSGKHGCPLDVPLGERIEVRGNTTPRTGPLTLALSPGPGERGRGGNQISRYLPEYFSTRHSFPDDRGMIQ